MNLKTTVPLATAGVLGLVAAIVAGQLVKQRPLATSADGTAPVLNLSGVVVAARDIAPGATLTAEDLKVLRIESTTVPFNTATDPALVAGRVAKVQVPAGQMVHESMLAERGVEGGLPGVIAPGMRAMTIEINEFTGLAGLLEPGNRIDILARVAEAEGNAQTTRTIVQDVPIIAVGAQLTSKGGTGTNAEELAPVVPDAAPQPKTMARSITVLVTPEDAEKIDLASATNAARVVLRASTDRETAQVSGATLATLRGSVIRAAAAEPGDARTAAARKGQADDVFGAGQTPTAPRAKSNVRTVTVIRAGVLSSVDLEEPSRPAETEPKPDAAAAAEAQSASVD